MSATKQVTLLCMIHVRVHMFLTSNNLHQMQCCASQQCSCCISTFAAYELSPFFNLYCKGNSCRSSTSRASLSCLISFFVPSDSLIATNYCVFCLLAGQHIQELARHSSRHGLPAHSGRLAWRLEGGQRAAQVYSHRPSRLHVQAGGLRT